MNKKILSIAFLALVAIGFQSCKDDDNGPSNKFTYDGTTYAAKTALITLDPSSNPDHPLYFHHIALLSEGFTVSDTDGEITGSGNAIEFSLIGNSGTELTPGTYSFNADENTYEMNDLIDGSVYVNFNAVTETGEEYDGITSGTVTVEKSGTDYTFTIDAISAVDSKQITGHFKGITMIRIDQ